MKCLYCDADLTDGDSNGFYTCNNSNHSGIRVTYLCSGGIRKPEIWILNLEISDTDCRWVLSSNLLNKTFAIYQQFYAHSNSKYHLKLDFLPPNLNPDNAADNLKRLMSLRAFS